jgi:hypothetical protein
MEQSRRPGSVTIAGWITSGLAAFTLVSAVLGALANLLVAPIPPEVPPPLRWVFAHYGQLALAQAAFALPALVSGMALLRRAPWARRASQVLMLTWASSSRRSASG